MLVNIVAASVIKNNSIFYPVIYEYMKRFSLIKVNVIEFEEKNLKQQDINEKIFSLAPKDSYKIMLDEKGKKFSTVGLKEFLGQIDTKEISFLIAGADGFLQSYKTKADAVMSLSDLTFPHQMARLLLIEQLYRVQSIISNHPYHRV